METETQKFLEAEETAEKLVHTLQELHTEATSYKTATKELDVVRQRLVSLIESTQQIAGESHEAVKVLRSIGGPEILDRLQQMETTQSKRLDKLSSLVTLTLTGVAVAIIVGIIALVK